MNEGCSMGVQDAVSRMQGAAEESVQMCGWFWFREF